MDSYRAARERLGLTQADLASLADVTQPAIAAYEAGRRHPIGRADIVMNGMLIVFKGANLPAEDGRGRPIELPEGRWEPIVSPDATVRLPVRLDWSQRGKRTRNLADKQTRAWAYAQVLDEGSPADIRFWIDPDALVDLWPDVPVARRLRPHVERLVQRLKAEPSWAV